MRQIATSLCFAAASLISSSALADVYTLQNDSAEDGDELAFQQGFATGESAAVTLGEVSDTFTVRKVQFLFGPAGAPVQVNVAVHADVGTDAPGALLYQGDYTITPSDDGLHEIDLTGDDVEHIGPGSVRVVIGVTHDGAPGVARDDDGCTDDKNWIELVTPPSWISSCDEGVQGDWVIRAEIDGPPPEGAAGEGGAGEGGAGEGGAPPTNGGAPSTGGAPSAGGASAGGGSGFGNGDDESDDGCGCSLATSQQTTPAWLAIGLAFAALRRRRSS
jgi:MYXO-CTERM domain-containing protein